MNLLTIMLAALGLFLSVSFLLILGYFALWLWDERKKNNLEKGEPR